MKTIVNLTAYILILLGLYSCNDDVFVDDFRTSDTEFTLDGNGDEVTIRFASSNWDLVWMYTYDSDFTHQYEVYDADDNLIMRNQDAYLKGLGKIVCNEKLTDFIIQRSNPKELKITVGENVRNDYFRFMLVVSNEYESQEIYVQITPSDRYVFAHITYSLNAYYSERKIEEEVNIVRSNFENTPSPLHLIVQGIRHKVTFRSDTSEAFQLLGDGNLTVEIPSIENGSLVMNGVQAQYTSMEQEFPFPDIYRDIFIPANTTQHITLMQEYEWFETEYTLYAIHPKTKKQRVITGMFQSTIPTDNYVKQENIK